MACVVEGCLSHTSRLRTLKYDENCEEHVSFHFFPKEKHLRNEWVRNISRPNWEPHERSRICSRHFTPDCFKRNGKNRRLTRDAVPVLHLGSPVDRLGGTYAERLNAVTTMGGFPIGLCAGCLASDRKLRTLRKDVYEVGLDLFQRGWLNTTSRNSQIKQDEDVILCWECHSMIVNIHKFQQKVKKAQEILESKKPYEKVECLSTLNVVTQICNFDYERYENFDNIIKQEDDEIVEDFPGEQYEMDTTEVPIDDNEHNIAKEEEEGYLGTFDKILNEDNVSDYIADMKQESDAQSYGNTFEDKFDTETGLEIRGKRQIDGKRSKKLRPDRHNSGKRRKKLGPPKKGANGSYEIVSLNMPQANEKNALGTMYAKIIIDQNEVKDLRNSLVRTRKLHLECDECSSRFGTNETFQKHIRFHLKESGKYICDICSKRMKTLHKMTLHCREHFLKFHCLICHKICFPRNAMLAHLKAHFKVFRCIICKHTFSKRQEFNEHYKKYHTKFICDHCGFKTPNRQYLERHIKHKHLEQKCHECNKVFGRRVLLNNHYRLHHTVSMTPEEAYCVECDRHFKNHALLKRHLSGHRHRRRKQIIPCPECDNVYTRKIFMDNHYAYVHLKRTKYYCDECCMYFLTSTSRNRHMIKHGIGEVKKNKLCPHCGRGFSTTKVLTHHIRTHTGERPYECTFCLAKFAQKYACKMHMKKQHNFDGEIQPLII